jgi:peroxiredoxin
VLHTSPENSRVTPLGMETHHSWCVCARLDQHTKLLAVPMKARKENDRRGCVKVASRCERFHLSKLSLFKLRYKRFPTLDTKIKVVADWDSRVCGLVVRTPPRKMENTSSISTAKLQLSIGLL